MVQANLLETVYPQGEFGGWRRALPIEALERVVFFQSEKQVPHWHIVTSGFREMGEEYELTLRLKRNEGELEPHSWTRRLLYRLAEYVTQSGQGFTNFDYADLEGIEIEEGSLSKYRGVAFIPDPELATNKTPEETAQFLQVVLLTQEQLEVMAGEQFMEFVENLKKENPLLIQEIL